MNVSAELRLVAARVVWFKPAEETLEDPTFFLAHVMTYGSIEDVISAKKYFAQKDFRQALEQAPPGLFDKRSWSYWNLIFGRRPAPPMPTRKFIATVYQLSWKTLPGLRGLSCSEFNAAPTATPDNNRGVAVEFSSEAQRDAFLAEIEAHFASRRFTNAADAFDTVKAYVLERAAQYGTKH